MKDHDLAKMLSYSSIFVLSIIFYNFFIHNTGMNIIIRIISPAFIAGAAAYVLVPEFRYWFEFNLAKLLISPETIR